MALRPYAALNPKQLAKASDASLYQFALDYAKQHGFSPTAVDIHGTVAGQAAKQFAGITGAGNALARRKAWAASLAHRTNEASRERALSHLLGTYGLSLPRTLHTDGTPLAPRPAPPAGAPGTPGQPPVDPGAVVPSIPGAETPITKTGWILSPHGMAWQQRRLSRAKAAGNQAKVDKYTALLTQRQQALRFAKYGRV